MIIYYTNKQIRKLPANQCLHTYTKHMLVSGRCERLEDQLNDLTELHQNETANLKLELASIEEKVAYQAYERARDIQVCM